MTESSLLGKKPASFAFSEHDHVLTGKMMTRDLDWVHWMLGITRRFRSLSTLRVFPAPKPGPRPPGW